MRSLAALAVLALGLAFAPAPAAAAADTADVTFAQDTFRAQENDGYATITVRRAGLPVSRMEVYYETGDGSAVSGKDYDHTAGRLVFDVGASEATFYVILHDDDVAERLEQVQLELSAVYGNGTTTGRPAVLMILDDDPVPLPTTTLLRDPAAGRSSVTAPQNGTASGGNGSAGGQPQVARRAASVQPRLSARQSPTTPFELRVQGGSEDDGGGSEDLAVDPSLAVLAGLLLAVVAGKVWFACRPE